MTVGTVLFVRSLDARIMHPISSTLETVLGHVAQDNDARRHKSSSKQKILETRARPRSRAVWAAAIGDGEEDSAQLYLGPDRRFCAGQARMPRSGIGLGVLVDVI